MSNPALDELLSDALKAERGLIPTLQAVQKLEGCFSDELIDYVSEKLNRASGEVSEVIDYYSFLHREKRGEHHIQICMATSCNAQGSAAVLEELRGELGINAGEVTADGRFSLEIKFCLGACGRGVNLMINTTPYNFVRPEDIQQILTEL